MSITENETTQIYCEHIVYKLSLVLIENLK